MLTDSIYCAVKVCCVLFSPFTVEESVVGLVRTFLLRFSRFSSFFLPSVLYPRSSAQSEAAEK